MGKVIKLHEKRQDEKQREAKREAKKVAKLKKEKKHLEKAVVYHKELKLINMAVATGKKTIAVKPKDVVSENINKLKKY